MTPSDRSIRSVLALTDFSATSDRAVDWAVALARAHGAELRILHGLERPGSTLSETFSIADQKSGPQRASAKLADLEEKLPSDVRARVEAREFRQRDMVSELDDDELADVIVIGASGHGPIRRLFLGSTATSVVQKAPRPVVTVHADDTREPRGIRSVLLPTDLTQESTRAARVAADVLPEDLAEARLVLLHVHRMPAPVAAAAGGAVAVAPAPPILPADDDARDRARAELDHIADDLRARGYRVEACWMQDDPGGIASIILHVAREAGVDLVALSTHNRAGLERLLAGSVAEKVLTSAPCPVLTIPTGPTEGGAAT